MPYKLVKKAKKVTKKRPRKPCRSVRINSDTVALVCSSEEALKKALSSSSKRKSAKKSAKKAAKPKKSAKKAAKPKKSAKKAAKKA